MADYVRKRDCDTRRIEGRRVAYSFFKADRFRLAGYIAGSSLRECLRTARSRHGRIYGFIHVFSSVPR